MRCIEHKAVPTGVLLASRFPLSLLPDMPDSVLWSQENYTPDREKLRQHWIRRTLFELRMLRELSIYDLHDVYRRLHGYSEKSREEGWSWCYRDRFKYRFDHVFASDTLFPIQAQYLQSLHEFRLSDHRPLEVVFAPMCTSE